MKKKSKKSAVKSEFDHTPMAVIDIGSTAIRMTIAEVDRANASVTGASIKEPIASVDKTTVLWENDPRQYTTERVFSPAVNKATEAINLNLNISGQETFNFYFERGNSTITGLGVTPAKH